MRLLESISQVYPLMEDEFYNVLLDWNAQKLVELLEFCAQDLLRRRKTFKKKNGPLKPKKVKKRKRNERKDGVEMGKHLGRESKRSRRICKKEVVWWCSLSHSNIHKMHKNNIIAYAITLNSINV